MGKSFFGFPIRLDANWAIQPQKIAGGLKFWIYEAEGLYTICVAKTRARIAQRLAFRICKMQVFLMTQLKLSLSKIKYISLSCRQGDLNVKRLKHTLAVYL